METLQLLVLFSVVSGCLTLDSLRFLVLGDWGGLPTWPYYTRIEDNVAKQMAAVTKTYGTKFNLALGDNFYFDGVTDVNDKRFTETFEKVFDESSLYNPWYFVAGNHDHNGNVSAQIAYSAQSKRWNFPDYYYTLSYDIPGGKTMDILMIDTILLCGNTKYDEFGDQPQGPEDEGKSIDQWNWIEAKLKSSRAQYLIVAGHFPVYSIAEHGPTQCLVDGLNPLLLKYNVTAYFSGHDHNLQHLHTEDTDKPRMNYFVSGAANFCDTSNEHAGDVPDGSSKYFWAKENAYGGFAYIEVTAGNMTFTFVDGKEQPLYTYVLDPRIGF